MEYQKKEIGYESTDDAEEKKASNPPFVSTLTAAALVVSCSGKDIDQLGKKKKKKYVKQVTGRHKDTELHLSARRGDLATVRDILNDIHTQMMENPGDADFDVSLIEMSAAMVNEVNEVGQTALMIATEKGHLGIVEELLKYSNEESLSRKNQSGYDALHMAVKEGHEDIVEILLNRFPRLSMTLGHSNSTPLISAAYRGHTGIVKKLLAQNSKLIDHSKLNGKNALHLSARNGHDEIVQALVEINPQLARRIDKKGQNALHMAVKGTSFTVVRTLLNADPTLVTFPDKFGNTPLHVATRKKRVELINELLRLPNTNVNALTRDQKTALDIVDGMPFSEECLEIKNCLTKCDGLRSHELNQPRDDLQETVIEIRNNVQIQLEQSMRTNVNVIGISKEIRKLHREGINNTTNSVTVVAVLFATVAFAAIFTVPGGNKVNGEAVVKNKTSFKVFFFFNALSLFISLAVVVVQITLVRGETKAERRVVEVINKMVWLASIFTSVAFIASSYIVVGRHYVWASLLVTIIGAIIMGSVLGSMTYYVIKSRRSRWSRKKRLPSNNGPNNTYNRYEPELEDSIYVI